ncbi:unnamed protein product [Hydatigera taeniaeformis]|uniref:Uncharacterized protein n=1 Tax=Hydatigena taeniaeformis TaxID=6205 RepID=A0A0R3WRN5_HYDTA|nr:unnamed protein product [Hydatigera taeniaeformis]
MRSLEDQCSPSLADIAIKSILDTNPVLKFAMTGFLDVSDTTGDVFYDVGPLKASDRLKSLQCYAKEPVNEGRPIWLLNITEVWTEEPSGYILPYDPELRKDVAGKQNKFVVDLMAQPGVMYNMDTKEAFQYCSI